MHLLGLLLAIDQPKPVAPPGTEGKVNMLMSWVTDLAIAACLVGVIYCGGKMAISHRRGDSGEHGAALGWTFAGCIVIASAAALVNALT